MRRLHPQISWRTDAAGTALDARVLGLLAGVRKHGTLRHAAAESGISYRAAWGLVNDAARLVGEPLVLMQRGTGAALSANAEALLEYTAKALAGIEPFALTGATRSSHAAHTRPGLRIVASHDLLLADWCDRWARTAGVVTSVEFRGSLESLEALRAGRADLAGFHLALPLDRTNSATVHRLLPQRSVTLIRFAAREQGLIVARGNPLRLRGLADVARRRIRFVNRQAGSGTRMLIDQLLREQGIAPDDVRGYSAEEHTHSAVAALVASGEADASFGLKAAAQRHGLGFVPIRRERYWLAAPIRRANGELVRTLCEGLRDAPFARMARRWAGYTITGAGNTAPAAAAFEPDAPLDDARSTTLRRARSR